ncbi:MAG: hypothetical protein HOP04_07115 [Methylophilaceae bacterium]|nr:hypothetical protein [Methylophilaceae bacterium]
MANAYNESQCYLSKVYPMTAGCNQVLDAPAWSAPDADGICEQRLDVGAKSTLRGKRLRRAFSEIPLDPAIWPVDRRELLILWLKSGDTRRKWETLLKLAGHQRHSLAHELLSALLKSGGIMLTEETRGRGHWKVLWVDFLQLAELRHKLGLPDTEAALASLQALSRQPFNNTGLQAAGEALLNLPPVIALARLALLRALDSWISQQRFGTRRDFALFARNGTKSLTAAEWTWLEAQVGLAEFGIERHTPALWLRAPLVLHMPDGYLDLRVIPDCIALTPDTLRSITHITGSIQQWRIVENRTSFERAARQFGDTDAVLWLPGFAPSWWIEAVTHLLEKARAPALIACDPDPAGIDIALIASRIWDTANQPWQPWGMDIATLQNLPSQQTLNKNDYERLQRQLASDLPAVFATLAKWMLDNDCKGEQEGAI